MATACMLSGAEWMLKHHQAPVHAGLIMLSLQRMVGILPLLIDNFRVEFLWHRGVFCVLSVSFSLFFMDIVDVNIK